MTSPEAAPSAASNADVSNGRPWDAPNNGASASGGEAAAAPAGEGHRRRRRRRRRRHHHGPQANAVTAVARPERASSRPPSEIDLAARRLGIQQLYGEQERVIRAALAGREVLVVLP